MTEKKGKELVAESWKRNSSAFVFLSFLWRYFYCGHGGLRTQADLQAPFIRTISGVWGKKRQTFEETQGKKLVLMYPETRILFCLESVHSVFRDLMSSPPYLLLMVIEGKKPTNQTFHLSYLCNQHCDFLVPELISISAKADNDQQDTQTVF